MGGFEVAQAGFTQADFDAAIAKEVEANPELSAFQASQNVLAQYSDEDIATITASGITFPEDIEKESFVGRGRGGVFKPITDFGIAASRRLAQSRLGPPGQRRLAPTEREEIPPTPFEEPRSAGISPLLPTTVPASSTKSALDKKKSTK